MDSRVVRFRLEGILIIIWPLVNSPFPAIDNQAMMFVWREVRLSELLHATAYEQFLQVNLGPVCFNNNNNNNNNRRLAQVVQQLNRRLVGR